MKKKLIMVWGILMIAGIFTVGCTYVAFQQTQRRNANQPAAMAAKQVVYKLKNNNIISKPWQALPESTDVDTNTPFVMIYNASKKLVASSANTVDKNFNYPNNSFDYINKLGENRVTWQPRQGYRFATVGVKYKGWYVIGAYSLTETENTVSYFTFILIVGGIMYAAASWILLMIVGPILLLPKIETKNKKKTK